MKTFLERKVVVRIIQVETEIKKCPTERRFDFVIAPLSAAETSEVQGVERNENQILECAWELSYAWDWDSEVWREYRKCGGIGWEPHNHTRCGNWHHSVGTRVGADKTCG